jgi:Ni/Fe-hydrogenase 1 B-type cytochrome subunit
MESKNAEASRHPLRFRILHMAIMLSIVFLILTGFYIHRPFVGGSGFFMTLVRGVHFFAAGVLIIATITRVLGMFIGSKKDWRSFFPTASDWALLPKTINYYAYIGKEVEIKKKYNPLQMITYSLVFILIVFQIISGFAILYPNGALSWFNYDLFFNSIQVRIAHYIVCWLFIMFLIIHVYLGLRETFGEMKEMHLLSDDETGTEIVKE